MRTLSTIPTHKDEHMNALNTIQVRPQQLAGARRRGAERPRWGFGGLALGVRSREPVDTSRFGEEWLTKREIAAHLRVTERFIELQQQVGLPVLRIGAVNRYRLSEVEAWIREQYPSTAVVRSA